MQTHWVEANLAERDVVCGTGLFQTKEFGKGEMVKGKSTKRLRATVAPGCLQPLANHHACTTTVRRPSQQSNWAEVVWGFEMVKYPGKKPFCRTCNIPLLQFSAEEVQ